MDVLIDSYGTQLLQGTVPEPINNLGAITTSCKSEKEWMLGLSRLTSLGCGQHLTSETCFFSQEHTHFGIHTTQFVYFCQSVNNTFKKSGKALFFLTV